MTSRSLQIFWRNAVAFLLVVFLMSPAATRAVQAAGMYSRISMDSSGIGADAISYAGDISADGRFAAFDSEAANLVLSDANNNGDVFLRDLTLGTTRLVSVTPTGLQADGGSGAPSISADGRFVAFESSATNLASTADTNNFTDIYLKDMQTGLVTRASLSSAGLEPNGETASPSISGDGRYVVFSSSADNLVANDTNGAGDIFVRDMQTGATLGVSVSGNMGGFDGSISLDGRFVVFNSRSMNFVPDDTNETYDVFVYSILTGQIARASVNSSGLQGVFASTEPSISGDGRYVTFSTSSGNFAGVDTLGFTQLYIRDMLAGVTTLASYQAGFVMVGTSDASEISADGRTIVYSFDDKGDGLPTRSLYTYDRVTAVNTMAVSTGMSNYEWNPILPSISGDGRYIVFSSSSPDLAPNDTNGTRDIFLKDLIAPPDLNPLVISSLHGCPGGCVSAADSFIDFIVKFSEPVTGVDATDFALTVSGGIAGAVILNVSGAGGEYIVHVDTGSGDGWLRLDILDDDSILDLSLNALGGLGAGNGGFTSGEAYLVDKSLARVLGIQRLDASPTAAGSLRYAVNFSEPVSGVDAADFVLTTTDFIGGALVTDVSGSGASYILTINTGVGDGTMRLDLIDNDSIMDAYSIPLGGAGIENGTFASGDVYTLHKTPPSVLSIFKLDADPATEEIVHFSVIFSQPVTFVDVSDFILIANGPVGVAITELSINANTVILTVGVGSGNGTIQLNVVDNDTLVNAVGLPLGGVGVGNGNVSGPFYSINKKAPEVKTEKLRSNGKNDGWILEASESSNTGKTKNSNAEAFRVGDDTQNRQYRSILHFPTHYLPDNAIITQAILMIKAQGITGTDPFVTHGNLIADICYGPYGSWGPFGINALQASDFQAPAGLSSAAVIQNNPVGGWYWAVLTPNAFIFINKTGNTQIRLGFQMDDNNDLDADYLTYFSGDAIGQADRPRLWIDYYVP